MLLCITACTTSCTGDGSGGNADSTSSGGAGFTPASTGTAATRPFTMGFTRWPSDSGSGARVAADQRIATQGELAVVQVAGGIPWPEALSGAPFSQSVEAELSYRPPSGHRLYLAVSPLSAARDALAPYWGASANMALPADWQARSFADLEVKTAFVNFMVRAIDRMQPSYVAIGIESNLLLTKSPRHWEAYKSFHRYVYTELKRRYQGLPVFFTVEILHLNGWSGGAVRELQYREVMSLMNANDLFVMSGYSFLSYAVPQSIDNDFFGFARGFGKPIAIGETGYPSQNTTYYNTLLYGSDALQQDYLEKLLGQAHRDRYEFITWFTAADFEPLVTRLSGASAEAARAWTFTGLFTSNGTPKPAHAVWQRYRTRPVLK